MSSHIPLVLTFAFSKDASSGPCGCSARVQRAALGISPSACSERVIWIRATSWGAPQVLQYSRPCNASAAAAAASGRDGRSAADSAVPAMTLRSVYFDRFFGTCRLRTPRAGSNRRVVTESSRWDAFLGTFRSARAFAVRCRHAPEKKMCQKWCRAHLCSTHDDALRSGRVDRWAALRHRFSDDFRGTSRPVYDVNGLL